MATNPAKLSDIHPIFEAAFNAGDLDALVSLYEPNALLIPAPGQLARGKHEIRSALEAFLAGRPTINIQPVACFETPEGIALTHGKWTIRGTGPDAQPFEMSGASAEVLRRQADGRWLYILDNPFAS